MRKILSLFVGIVYFASMGLPGVFADEYYIEREGRVVTIMMKPEDGESNDASAKLHVENPSQIIECELSADSPLIPLLVSARQTQEVCKFLLFTYYSDYSDPNYTYPAPELVSFSFPDMENIIITERVGDRTKKQKK